MPRNVWLISLVLLVSRSGTMVLPFLSIYCSKDLGFEPTSIGFLLSAYGVGSVLAGLMGGRVTQRIGSIPTQILSLAMAIPGFLLVGMATEFWWLMAALFYLSLGVEMMRPACATATVEFCDDPSQHTKAFAVNRLAVNLGMTLGPALGGFLALIDYQLLFYVNAVSTLCAMILMLHFFGWRQPQPQATTNVASKEVSEPSRSPFLDLRFMSFCLLNTLAACVLFQFLSTYPLYLKEQYQFQENHIGLLYAVNTVVIVLFELILVSAIARFPLLRTYAWGQLLSCVGFGILPFAVGSAFWPGALFCVFSMLVLTLGEMLTSPLGPAYAAGRADESNRGRYMGVYVTSFSVAVLVSPLVGMWLYDKNPHLVWYVSLIVGGVVFFGLLLLANREEEESNTKTT